LGEAIESVLAQDYPALECIIVDDGSTDGTHELLMDYSTRIRVIRQANSGQVEALNKGWVESNGSYLSYLSDDDYLYPDAIAKLVACLEEHPEAPLAYGTFHTMDEVSKVIRHFDHRPFNHFRLSAQLECQVGVGVLWRRMVLDRLGGWNRDIRQCPDLAYWMDVALLGPFMAIPFPAGKFRVHPGSLTYRGHQISSQDHEKVVELHYQGGDPAHPKAEWYPEARAWASIKDLTVLLKGGQYAAFFSRILRDRKLLGTTQLWRGGIIWVRVLAGKAFYWARGGLLRGR
jgi:glycosyltransferase involved in cell wall biosynthesis